MKNYNCTIICHQQLNDGLETISFSKIATSSDVEAILFASNASFWYWNAKHAYNLKGSYNLLSAIYINFVLFSMIHMLKIVDFGRKLLCSLLCNVGFYFILDFTGS